MCCCLFAFITQEHCGSLTLAHKNTLASQFGACERSRFAVKVIEIKLSHDAKSAHGDCLPRRHADEFISDATFFLLYAKMSVMDLQLSDYVKPAHSSIHPGGLEEDLTLDCTLYLLNAKMSVIDLIF